MTKAIQGIIIGGSPSTGSSLLRQLLNRHSEIVCAPETHIWCKHKIFEDWDMYKLKYLNRSIFGLDSKGLMHFVGIEASEIPNYNSERMKQLLEQSPDVYVFFRLFMMEFFKLRAGQVYGEKTPANAINFKHILETTDDVLCIHTIRNPYDAIASLVARGKTPLAATAFYLYNSAHGLSSRKNNRLVEIRYEDLVENPKLALGGLLSKLTLGFEEQMLNASKNNNAVVTKLEGWNYDETQEVKKGSVGRFNQMDQKIKDDIVLYVWYLKLRRISDVGFKSVREINEILDYKTIEPNFTPHKKDFDALKVFNRSLLRGLDKLNSALYLFEIK